MKRKIIDVYSLVLERAEKLRGYDLGNSSLNEQEISERQFGAQELYWVAKLLEETSEINP